MFTKQSLPPVALLLFLFASPLPALACACCIDPGFYSISTARPFDYELAFLDEMKFDTAAHLYESVAGFDAIRGLSDLRKEEEVGRPIELSVLETFIGKVWRLDLKSASGHEGSLVLPMPKKMVKFKVDLHDNEPGTEPRLYKELRFKGTVGGGTGFLRKDIVRPTTYFLVFQGRGNGCDSSTDFTHWRLELNGPKAEYALFGQLK